MPCMYMHAHASGINPDDNVVKFLPENPPVAESYYDRMEYTPVGTIDLLDGFAG